MSKIHATAFVGPGAELEEDVEVGAYSVIGPQVKIGKGTRIRSHVVIEGNTTLGQGNLILQFASVGSVPQDLKYRGEDSRLIIGNHNTIREFVSLNPGTAGGGMVTRIGDHNLLMMYCHIAHDCILGGHNIVANGATLGGHVVIEDYVIVGGLVGIHQFVKVGTSAILGAGSMVSKDIPPYCTATGDRARLRGLNLEGLRRRGFTKVQIEGLKKAYRIIFQSGLKVRDALKKVKEEIPNSPEVEHLNLFVENSQRGICR
ncbi:MAG: acyl-[acyl-carrier-protein]--UDP-N-acetylglucosamine O-acyltransferase [Deltaproteobacteria bacterium GWA2_57_13]|nr:MAG: acyl-[acyl-carrier-protein]--UDP-N-acetylglucosamine O-acyltransferase [Deltaproteobacteria bacterium GWA2_57_13]OGQ50847.1 MAG: acyl-[acyl-carrier-protein]--UDP-N-acetylglucosamine O-acyltransferase [Deltaproteobacteria bacterium RIFCSPLOWO2_02_FULL_57_26]OGQ82331.1 MAG: acyl-[acyl-carrier-protein]--UDP-N-acetylglucosamine O-acyltransferase [Deltaproteobacteria bacterium RIFCSPLOWO2_12_FULL_57_22]